MRSELNRIVITAGIFVVIIAGIILASYIGLHKPETTLVPERGVSSQVTAEVNKYIFIKIVSSDKKVTVYVPPNAIKNEGYFVLISMEPNIFTDPNGEWKRPIVVSLNLFDRYGKIINKPTLARFLDICFLLGDDESAGFLNNRENYYIQYYEEKQNENKWINLSYSIKSNNKQLCGEIDHLTLFSLAIKGKVEILTPTIKPYTP
jgi:hypothetical protein